MKKKGLVISLMMLLLMAVKTPASIITFTHEGSGSGTLNGIAFSESDFVVTATGDTDHLDSSGSYALRINHLSASILIAGLGNFDFVTPTKTFVNYNHGSVGLSRATTVGGGDLFNGPTDAQFQTWDMLSSIGPISGSGYLLQWDYSRYADIETTGGRLIFTSENCFATFTASVIPEPATLLLLGLGGLALRLKRNR